MSKLSSWSPQSVGIWDLFNRLTSFQNVQSLVISLSTLRSNMFSTRNLSKHQPTPRSTKCGTLNFLMEWEVMDESGVKSVRQNLEEQIPSLCSMRLGRQGEILPDDVSPLAKPLLQQCLNGNFKVFKITYSFTVETTCSCKNAPAFCRFETSGRIPALMQNIKQWSLSQRTHV